MRLEFRHILLFLLIILCKTKKDRMNYTRFYPYITFLLLLFAVGSVFGKTIDTTNRVKSIKLDSIWADSVFKSLTPRERIAQLFIVSAYSKDKEPEKDIIELVAKENIGGIIFFQGTPHNEAKLTNYYQSIAKTPLAISIDGEWGVAMRLDSVPKIPYQMTMGALQNDQLIYDAGVLMGKQCNRLGIQIDYAPSVDINNNSQNPVINFRSFGEDKYSVSRKAIALMHGLQSCNVIATAKHFPGHGDTDVDSHQGLPMLPFDKHRLDSLEIYPFGKIFKAGVRSVMVAHLEIPKLDTVKNEAASISKNIVQKLLIDSMKYDGLIMTDALNMNGVAKYNRIGELELKALKAGNDILLCSSNPKIAIDSIEKAIHDSTFMQNEIDRRCKKVLAAKYWMGLNKLSPINLKNITKDLNSLELNVLSRKIFESAMTVLVNKSKILPLKSVDTLCASVVSVGSNEVGLFQQMINNFMPTTNYCIHNEQSLERMRKAKDTLLGSDLVIVGLHCKNQKANKNYGVSKEMIAYVDSLLTKRNVILAVLGNPFILKDFANLNAARAVVVGYQNDELAMQIIPQVIFGAQKAEGRLPITISKYFPMGSGLDLNEIIRLKYTIPEDAGVSSSDLKKVDSIALLGIAKRAYPGCQVLIAKSGKVIYNKSFGYHTYDLKQPVLNTDLYDIASVTKVASTTMAMMMLDNQQKVDIDAKLSSYLELPRNNNIGNIDLRSLLSHIARLTPWIPFYADYFLKPDSIRAKIISKTYKEGFTLHVADSMYIADSFKDSVYNRIYCTKLLPKQEYKYSDLGFYLLKQVVEKQTNSTIDKFVMDNLYRPLGLTTMGYNPIKRFPKSRIMPTEDDNLFRKQLLQGYVHDQGAALLGGVSGHAGLFSDANDLAVLMQMLLNKGTYGGTRYFGSDIMDKYNSRYYVGLGNRRALGFDKPAIGGGGPVPKCASDMSFGHTGFTGTMIWVDPKYDLIYIFLSNRVYPDAENNKLRDMNIRTDIQQVIYDAILKNNKN